ncbi:MAG: PorT family protein [Flavobacteriales bacterium]|nr:PorT family protein [Flavobacteriales bacterium]
MAARFLLLLGLGLCMSPASGQLAIGFRGGVSWSNMDFPSADELDTRARTTPCFGLALNAPLSLRLSLQPELAYVNRGYRLSYEPAIDDVTGEHWSFDYVDLNMLAVVRLGNESARPHLLMGPAFGVMTGARLLTERDGSPSGGSVIDPVKLRLNRAQAGLCAGAGFTFTTGSSVLVIECRYAYGLTDVFGNLTLVDVNGVTIRELKAYDRSLSVSVTWLMPVPKRASETTGG